MNYISKPIQILIAFSHTNWREQQQKTHDAIQHKHDLNTRPDLVDVETLRTSPAGRCGEAHHKNKIKKTAQTKHTTVTTFGVAPLGFVRGASNQPALAHAACKIHQYKSNQCSNNLQLFDITHSFGPVFFVRQ